jgi:hypothetical protein
MKKMAWRERIQIIGARETGRTDIREVKKMAEKQDLHRIVERLNAEFSERGDGYTDHVSHLVAELL